MYQVIVKDYSGNAQLQEKFSFYEEALETKECYEKILEEIPASCRGTVLISE